jgi:hypothetical protein
MKTVALIGLIIVATASAGMAAETSMTIQTNTGIRVDPVTGWIKGDAETQVRGIRKHHEAPQAINTSPGGPSSDNTGAATTPVTVTTPTDPNGVTIPVSVTAPTDPTVVATPVTAITATDPSTATTPVSAAAPTDQNTIIAPVGAAPPANAATNCPLAQVSGRLSN